VNDQNQIKKAAFGGRVANKCLHRSVLEDRNHRFECQALAHAIMQTPSFQWGSFFSQVQLLPQGQQSDNKKQQPSMVMSRLAAVVEMHKYISVCLNASLHMCGVCVCACLCLRGI
jgi:hypothetical protein